MAKEKDLSKFQYDTRDENGNPISPVNGQPVPKGKQITSENAREMQKKSHQAITEKRSIARAFKERLTTEFTDSDGNKMTGAEIIAMSIFKGANDGNARMVEIALGLIGEKPAEKIVLAEVEQSVIDDVERMVFSGENN